MRRCERCGLGIVTTRADARFCSSKCRIYAHRAAKRVGLPSEMIAAARWLRHTATKVPLTVYGDPASSTNPRTWNTYIEALNSPFGVGLGFALGDGFACIDLDHCLENGHPTPATTAFVNRYPRSYIEISPSGDGLHIWGTAPEQSGTKRNIDGLSIETYSAGRYITVTGNIYQHGTLQPL